MEKVDVMSLIAFCFAVLSFVLSVLLLLRRATRDNLYRGRIERILLRKTDESRTSELEKKIASLELQLSIKDAMIIALQNENHELMKQLVGKHG